MNIYQKLQQARVTLQNLGLRQTGNNKYSNYTYYEFSDFLPAINKICNELGLFTKFNIIRDGEKELAVLKIINSEKPSEKLDFISETAEVKIGKKDGTGGAQPIQNLGGKITYMRRYLYITAFEIVEPDIVEKVNKNFTNDVSDKDLEKIKKTQSVEDLTKLFKEMQKTYKVRLIKDLFSEQRTKLEQEAK